MISYYPKKNINISIILLLLPQLLVTNKDFKVNEFKVFSPFQLIISLVSPAALILTIISCLILFLIHLYLFLINFFYLVVLATK